MPKTKKIKKPKFLGKYICRNCNTYIEKRDIKCFVSHHIDCPFCGKPMWLYDFKHFEFWKDEAIEESNKNLAIKIAQMKGENYE